MNTMQKSHSISRPLSQLAKQQQHQQLIASTAVSLSKHQQKSQGKLCTGTQAPQGYLFDLNNSAADQLLQL
jgi:hypothetical protein